MKTVLALRQRYHFRGMRKAVAKVVNNCVRCRRAKSFVDVWGSPLVPMLSHSPFRVIAIDLYAPGSVTADGYRYVLTIVDLCTRHVVFLPLKTKYPAEVLDALTANWFYVHGLLEIIISDRGKEFLGVVTVVCEVLDVRQIRTTPYHPRTNGLCESQHKVSTRELKIMTARPTGPQWPTLLPEIAFAHNVTQRPSMGNVSPFQMVCGRQPRLTTKDVTFSLSNRTEPIPNGETHREYVQSKQDSLRHMRFHTLDWEFEK